MVNLFSLCLLLSSLLAAQVWSPNPSPTKNDGKEDVIVKEGHRVIVVETYDENGQHNTKVSISPPQDPISEGGLLENAKEKIKQAANILPNVGRSSVGAGHAPGQLVCEPSGECRHKIARATSKAKDQAYDTAHEVAAGTEDVVHAAKDIAHDALDKKKRLARDAYEKTKEKTTQKAHEAKEVIEDAYEKTKESAPHKAHDVKETAKDSLYKAKDTVKSAKDTGKTLGTDAATNVSQQVGNLKESTEQARSGIGKMLKYLGSTHGLNCMMRVLNLLGFATAYGMGMWVTFISSHVLAGSLTRSQFGIVQSKIYPVYFRAMAYSIFVALLGHIVGQRQKLFVYRKAEMLQVFNFLASILVVLTNALYLEPSATKVMFEKLKIEKEEGRGRESQAAEISRAEPSVTGISEAATITTTTTGAGAAASAETETPEQREMRSKMDRMNERLKRLNSYSSFLNILTLMALSWHLVYLGRSLHGNCS